MTEAERPLRMAMAGGGRGSFIGGVHRAAARLTGEIAFTAGALSSDPHRAIESGRELGLADDRIYRDWQSMLEDEAAKPPNDRIDFVAIVTPNAAHFEIAAEALRRGFHVICDKPLTTRTEDARTLVKLAEQTRRVVAVTYNYSGYPMVRAARQLVRSGRLGEIRKVLVEYHQGWLSQPIEREGQKQAAWRTDPTQAGAGGAIGDIGTHGEHLLRFVTGLEIESLSALTHTFVPGRRLDDDANVMMRLSGGAIGVLIASQICTGQRNGLVLRVWGTKAGLEWQQETPNHLVLRPDGEPEQILHRGEAYLPPSAASFLPPGHPEAFLDAFASIYRGAAARMRGGDGECPDAADGLRGVQFMHAVLESSRRGSAWLEPGTPLTDDFTPIGTDP